jgi:outer membrane cobalamin receptor
VKTNLIKKFLSALLILFAITINAQDSASITGFVKDSKTGEALLGANVYLKGTHIGNSSDVKGNFNITSVPAGTWLVVCSMVGYTKAEQEITIGTGENIKKDFILEEDPLVFSSIVVTATRNEALVTSIPVATDVINTKMLEESNAKNIGEALKTIGSSLVKSYGALGSLESVSLRGSTAAQVLVLIDGQKLNSAQDGSVDLSTIPFDAIERIEVVKGGNSAMYGSDAVGGVINVITKSMARQNKLTYSVNGMYGTYNTQDYQASVGQDIHNFDYFLSYSRTQSDGDFEYTNLEGIKKNLVNGDTQADNFFIKTGYLLPDQSHLSAFYKYRKSENGSPGSIDYPNLSARSKVDNNHVSLSYEGLSAGPFAFNMNSYFIKNKYTYYNPEAYSGIEESLYDTREIGASLQVFTDLGQIGLLSYGYEFRQDKLESDKLLNGAGVPFMGEHQRNVNSVYFQDDWKYDFDHVWKLSVVPAVRLDSYPEDGVGSQFSPKIGIAFSHDDTWRGSVRGNVGRVFRAPTYSDLYWPEDSWTKGNPELKPEKGITYDFGFIVQFAELGSWNIEMTYFASKLDDLILWASGANYIWKPENVSKANTNGLESKIGWRGLNNIVGLQATYTRMDVKDDGDDPLTSGKYLIYRPKDKFDFALNLNYGIASMNVYYNFTGKRFHDEENKTELESFGIVNANIGVTPKLFGTECLFKLAVNNIGDKEYQAVKSSPLPGREIRVTFGIKGSVTGL